MQAPVTLLQFNMKRWRAITVQPTRSPLEHDTPTQLLCHVMHLLGAVLLVPPTDV